MINKQLLVCNDCYDRPQEQLRAIILPADPVPISNPRIQDYPGSETNVRYTSGQNTTAPWVGIPVPGGDVRITQDDSKRVTQQTGEAPFGKNERPGTDPAAPGDADPGLPYGYDEVPETGPLE